MIRVAGYLFEKHTREAGFSTFDYSWWVYWKKFEEAGLDLHLHGWLWPSVTGILCICIQSMSLTRLLLIDILDCNGGDYWIIRLCFKTNQLEINSVWGKCAWAAMGGMETLVEIPPDKAIKREYGFWPGQGVRTCIFLSRGNWSPRLNSGSKREFCLYEFLDELTWPGVSRGCRMSLSTTLITIPEWEIVPIQFWRLFSRSRACIIPTQSKN